MPDSPDAVVALRPYGGRESEDTIGRFNIFRRPRIQVVARAESHDYEAAQTKANACYLALCFADVTINSVRYTHVKPLQDPFTIRQDDNGRWEIGFNIEAEYAPTN